MDVFSKAKRSRIMSRIRSSGTKPEIVMRGIIRGLTSRRLRYNVRSLPGSPDVVVRSASLAVFMDGCFFHGCPDHGRIPKSNARFWREKIRKNAARDRSVRRALRRAGWTVWCFWEHELRPSSIPSLRRRVARRMERLEAVLGTVQPTTRGSRSLTEKEMPTKTTAKKTTAKKTAAKKPTSRKSSAKTTKPAKSAARKPSNTTPASAQ